MLSEKALAEFKQIWREEFGADIRDDLAVEEATALLTLFNAVYRPIKQKWSEEYDQQNRQKNNR